MKLPSFEIDITSWPWDNYNFKEKKARLFDAFQFLDACYTEFQETIEYIRNKKPSIIWIPVKCQESGREWQYPIMMFDPVGDKSPLCIRSSFDYCFLAHLVLKGYLIEQLSLNPKLGSKLKHLAEKQKCEPIKAEELLIAAGKNPYGNPNSIDDIFYCSYLDEDYLNFPSYQSAINSPPEIVAAFQRIENSESFNRFFEFGDPPLDSRSLKDLKIIKKYFNIMVVRKRNRLARSSGLKVEKLKEID